MYLDTDYQIQFTQINILNSRDTEHFVTLK